MQVKITGFSEDDQTNLYMMAHDASGKGRQGLGIASRPKKVVPLVMTSPFPEQARHVWRTQGCLGFCRSLQQLDMYSTLSGQVVRPGRSVQVAGARWQGTKKRLEESEDEQTPASEEQAQPAVQPDSEDCSEDTHISPREQTQHHGEPEAVEQQPQNVRGPQTAPASEQVTSAKALLKAARRVLGAAPGGSLRQKKLEKRVLDLLEVQRGSSERRQMRRALLAAINSSTKLKLSEGMVTC